MRKYSTSSFSEKIPEKGYFFLDVCIWRNISAIGVDVKGTVLFLMVL